MCSKFLEIWSWASSLSVMVGQGLPWPISGVDHALFFLLMPSLGLPLNSLFVPCKHDFVPNNGFSCVWACTCPCLAFANRFSKWMLILSSQISRSASISCWMGVLSFRLCWAACWSSRMFCHLYEASWVQVLLLANHCVSLIHDHMMDQMSCLLVDKLSWTNRCWYVTLSCNAFDDVLDLCHQEKTMTWGTVRGGKNSEGLGSDEVRGYLVATKNPSSNLLGFWRQFLLDGQIIGKNCTLMFIHLLLSLKYLIKCFPSLRSPKFLIFAQTLVSCYNLAIF